MQGPQGEAGPLGPKGDRGEMGPRGERGFVGPAVINYKFINLIFLIIQTIYKK